MVLGLAAGLQQLISVIIVLNDPDRPNVLRVSYSQHVFQVSKQNICMTPFIQLSLNFFSFLGEITIQMLHFCIAEKDISKDLGKVYERVLRSRRSVEKNWL